MFLSLYVFQSLVTFWRKKERKVWYPNAIAGGATFYGKKVQRRQERSDDKVHEGQRVRNNVFKFNLIKLEAIRHSPLVFTEFHGKLLKLND